MGMRKTPEETAKRRADVKDFMETIGPYSVPVKTLAEKYSVTLKVIYNDIQFWIKKMSFKKMELEGKKLIMAIRKNLSITESLKVDGTKAEKLKAIQTSNQTAEVYTKLLEQYGFKEKIADNLNVVADLPVTINLIEKSVEEIKRDKLIHKSKAEGDSESSG